ncbi:hypothetical protein KBD49_07910 [Myxococcota bacterium]|jgi:beta-N-acetylhexosaminidase|nr:hypothetical protein [Myxococcota bacterium]
MEIRDSRPGAFAALLATVASLAGWSCSGDSRASRDLDGGNADDQVLDAPAPDAFDPSSVARPFCSPNPDRIEEILGQMSPLQRIGQHLVFSLARDGRAMDAKTWDRLRRYFPGGGFVSQVTGVAVRDHESTARFLRDAQAASMEASGVPLLVATDQEGGVYSVLQHRMGGTDNIGPTAIGSTGSPWVAFRQFAMMGREIRALGIQMDFAPLLDTHYRWDNGNLNTRTFGPDVDLNAELGVAACLGLQQEGVIPTLKHFPGDGMTAGNTHHEFVVNTASRQELDDRLLKPFRSAFQAGCDAVMVIPARYDALDPSRSAVTSRPVITGFLRGELGFDGLVVTDDLGMRGALQGLGPGDIPGLEALKAGADLLLYVSVEDKELDALVEAIAREVAARPDFAAELDESTRRILRHKQKYCLLDRPIRPDEEDIAALPSRIGRPEDAAMSRAHAEQAVVLLEDHGVLPLTNRRVACIGPAAYLPDPASGWSWVNERSFCESLRARDPSVQFQDFLVEGTEEQAAEWLESVAPGSDVVVVATFQAAFSPAQESLLDRLAGGSLPVVHVMQGVPFDWWISRGRVSAAVALMGGLPVMFDAGTALIYGDIMPAGTMRWDPPR